MKQQKNDEPQRIWRHWHTDVPHDRIAHLVRDAGRLFGRSLKERLGEHDISFGHWSFLRILWVCEGLTQRELSEEAGVMEPTTYTALNAMEKNGLIERRHLPGNRRKVHVYLTDKGRELKQVLVPLAEECNHIALDGIAPEDVETMRRVLLRIIDNLATEYAT